MVKENNNDKEEIIKNKYPFELIKEYKYNDINEISIEIIDYLKDDWKILVSENALNSIHIITLIV